MYIGPKNDNNVVRFCGVVVITSALHAEGREFEPRQNLHVFLQVLVIRLKNPLNGW